MTNVKLEKKDKKGCKKCNDSISDTTFKESITIKRTTNGWLVKDSTSDHDVYLTYEDHFDSNSSDLNSASPWPGSGFSFDQHNGPAESFSRLMWEVWPDLFRSKRMGGLEVGHYNMGRESEELDEEENT